MRSWAAEVRNVSVLVAIGVGADGLRQILGVGENEKEELEGWRGFLRYFKDRGVHGFRPIISDACGGPIGGFPQTDWQRYVVDPYRNVFSHVPNGKMADEAGMFKVIHAPEDLMAARTKITEIVRRLRDTKLKCATGLVEQKVGETLTYLTDPSTHWQQIKTINPLRRIIREIRRWTRVVGAFPDGHSALMLVAARLGHIASTKWGKRRYIVTDPKLNPAKLETAARGAFSAAFDRSDRAMSSPPRGKIRSKKISHEWRMYARTNRTSAARAKRSSRLLAARSCGRDKNRDRRRDGGRFWACAL